MADVKKIPILCLITEPSSGLRAYLDRFEFRTDFTVTPFEEYVAIFVDTVLPVTKLKEDNPRALVVLITPTPDYAQMLASNVDAIIPESHINKLHLDKLLRLTPVVEEPIVTANFFISGYLGAGHYSDQLACEAYRNKFNHLSVRSFLIEFSSYLAYLEDERFVQYPIEISYQVSDTFQIEITLNSNKFYKDLLWQSMSEIDQDSPYKYLFKHSLNLTHSFEIFWKKPNEQITFRVGWWKERTVKPAIILREVKSYERFKSTHLLEGNKIEGAIALIPPKVPGIHPHIVSYNNSVTGAVGVKKFHDEVIRVKGVTTKFEDVVTWVRGNPDNSLGALTDMQLRAIVDSIADPQKLLQKKSEWHQKRNELLRKIPREELLRKVKAESQIKASKLEKAPEGFEDKVVSGLERALEKIDNPHVFDEFNSILASEIELPEVDLNQLVEQIIDSTIMPAAEAEIVDQDILPNSAAVVAPASLGAADPSNMEMGFLLESIQKKNEALKRFKKVTETMKEEIKLLKETEEKMIREKMEHLANTEGGKVGVTEREIILGLQGELNSLKRIAAKRADVLDRFKNASKRNLDQKVHEIERLRHRCNELVGTAHDSSIVMRITHENEMIKAEKDSLDSMLQRAQDKISKLTIALKKKEEDDEAKHQALLLEREQIEANKSEFSRLKEENTIFKLKIEEQAEFSKKSSGESDVKQLEGRNRLLEVKLKNLEEELERQRKKSASNKEKSSDEMSAGMTQKQMESLKAQVEDMNEQMSQKKKELVKMKSENIAFKNKIAELERKLGKYNKKAS